MHVETFSRFVCYEYKNISDINNCIYSAQRHVFVLYFTVMFCVVFVFYLDILCLYVMLLRRIAIREMNEQYV